ncbi:DUF4041 domain-containing protein [Actinomycetospora sp. NBRC 106378]|uniref:DUF4041 domain-containing protein n=1 Tax=Actinomycetospora sp. NBRC 106378 TaxID=3032208 RepID=UPI002554FCB9|nr:DUF4041 domain-containing protein [Actinomycetospora sp. NBRC 106378]
MEAENSALAERVAALEAELAHTRAGAGREIHALRGQAGQLSARVAALQNKDVAALEQETALAAEQLARTRAELVAADDAARAAQQRAHKTHEQSEARERAATAEAERIVLFARTEAKDRVRVIERDLDRQQARLAELQAQIVVTEDLAMLQEAGIYEYRHRLADAVAYKSQLDHLKDAIKTLVRRDSAILSTTSWTVNGSTTEGRKMVRDFSKLMLRAYNAEADNCVRTMRPHRLPSSIERLDKARDTIAKLGATMHIRIDPGYHSTRVQELELTADYLAKQEEEKERIRAERERQRDEDAARKEFEREKTRLAKEQSHWERVQQKWETQGDEDKVAEAAEKLAEIGEAIAGVERREANIRTGWVYVISNVGAFGENMVKIGLTRRLDPRERVRELGDASVPFRFDVHALVFSEDAVSLENRLHHDLADRRVNRVNLRREFFRATPAEVLDVLGRTEARKHLLEYTEFAEAEEWRTSLALSGNGSEATEG